jgi:hypothetical protein
LLVEEVPGAIHTAEIIVGVVEKNWRTADALAGVSGINDWAWSGARPEIRQPNKAARAKGEKARRRRVRCMMGVGVQEE